MAVRPRLLSLDTNYRQAGNTGKSTIGAQVILPKYEPTFRDCQGNSASSRFSSNQRNTKSKNVAASTRECGPGANPGEVNSVYPFPLFAGIRAPN